MHAEQGPSIIPCDAGSLGKPRSREPNGRNLGAAARVEGRSTWAGQAWQVRAGAGWRGLESRVATAPNSAARVQTCKQPLAQFPSPSPSPSLSHRVLWHNLTSHRRAPYPKQQHARGHPRTASRKTTPTTFTARTQSLSPWAAMEFFENQVGEFRNLLGTAAAPSPGTPGSAVGPNSAHHQHHHHQHEHPPLSLSHHQPHAQHQLQHSSGPMSAAATPGHGATPLPAQLYGAASTPTSSAAYPPARAAPGSKRKNTAPASIGDDDDGDASPGSRGGAAGQRSKRSRYISIAW